MPLLIWWGIHHKGRPSLLSSLLYEGGLLFFDHQTQVLKQAHWSAWCYVLCDSSASRAAFYYCISKQSSSYLFTHFWAPQYTFIWIVKASMGLSSCRVYSIHHKSDNEHVCLYIPEKKSYFSRNAARCFSCDSKRSIFQIYVILHLLHAVRSKM